MIPLWDVRSTAGTLNTVKVSRCEAKVGEFIAKCHVGYRLAV